MSSHPAVTSSQRCLAVLGLLVCGSSVAISCGGGSVDGAGSTDPPRLVAVLPRTETVPSNLLRFRLRFDRAMRRGRSVDHVRILDDRGGELANVIHWTRSELWNPELTELTLLINPGRSKSGVRPHSHLGTALFEGRSIHLLVEAGWPAVDGGVLVEGGSVAFNVGPAQRTAIDPHDWVLTTPAAGTRQALEAQFSRALDETLLLTSISVLQSSSVVNGALRVVPGGRGVHFTPEQPWEPGQHELGVAARLEDLAGNRVSEPFERPLAMPAQALSIPLPWTPR